MALKGESTSHTHHRALPLPNVLEAPYPWAAPCAGVKCGHVADESIQDGSQSQLSEHMFSVKPVLEAKLVLPVAKWWTPLDACGSSLLSLLANTFEKEMVSHAQKNWWINGRDIFKGTLLDNSTETSNNKIIKLAAFRGVFPLLLAHWPQSPRLHNELQHTSSYAKVVREIS